MGAAGGAGTPKPHLERLEAFTTDASGETDSLKGFDAGRCAVYRGVIDPTGWGVCGLCVQGGLPLWKEIPMSLRATLWFEGRQVSPGQWEIYPDGMHGAIAAFLERDQDIH